VAIKKGLSTLVNISPNFSDQAIENSVNQIKVGWVIKSFELDAVITANSVLSLSQKNDIKDDCKKRIKFISQCNTKLQ